MSYNLQSLFQGLTSFPIEQQDFADAAAMLRKRFGPTPSIEYLSARIGGESLSPALAASFGIPLEQTPGSGLSISYSS